MTGLQRVALFFLMTLIFAGIVIDLTEIEKLVALILFSFGGVAFMTDADEWKAAK